MSGDVDARAALRVLDRTDWRLEPADEERIYILLRNRRVAAKVDTARLRAEGMHVHVDFRSKHQVVGGKVVSSEEEWSVHMDLDRMRRAQGVVVPAPARSVHVLWCPVRAGLPEDQCSCYRPIQTCGFVGLDGSRCDLDAGHTGDCILAEPAPRPRPRLCGHAGPCNCEPAGRA